MFNRRLEESEKKRQAMMQAMKDQANKSKGPNFTISKKELAGVNLQFIEKEKELTPFLLFPPFHYQCRLTTNQKLLQQIPKGIHARLH